MPTPRTSDAERRRRTEAIEDCLREGYAPLSQSGGKGAAMMEAARRLGITPSSLNHAVRQGHCMPDWSLYQEPGFQPRPVIEIPKAADTGAVDRVLTSLRKKRMTLEEIAVAAGITKGQALDAIEAAHRMGANLHEIDGRWSVESVAAPAFLNATPLEYVSRPDNTFLFGATSDNHLGSKYERLDVLENLYDRFARAEVDRVFNAGNWIDGEARFNRFDLKIHGMDAQLRYLAKHYPKRPGLKTYSVAGDDHEGWYTQSSGVNIGRAAERSMEDAGRDDWCDLGYMESHVKLINANTGKHAMMSVVHPGGGSAYALSYSIQKIIESLDGGEKPAVGLYGHYHKLWAGNIRNVWCLQTGCTEDQTPFMRKKRLEAHVGGAIVGLEQDPETGAIVGFTPKMFRYFNRGYYENRWSHSGDVTLPERSIA